MPARLGGGSSPPKPFTGRKCSIANLAAYQIRPKKKSHLFAFHSDQDWLSPPGRLHPFYPVLGVPNGQGKPPLLSMRTEQLERSEQICKKGGTEKKFFAWKPPPEEIFLMDPDCYTLCRPCICRRPTAMPPGMNEVGPLFSNLLVHGRINSDILTILMPAAIQRPSLRHPH